MILTKNKPLHLLAGAVATFNLLMLRLMIKNPSNAKTYPGRVFREYMSLVESDRWESRDILEILKLQEGIRVTIEHLPGKGVGTPIDELACLAIMAKAIQPAKIFEIGTFRGRVALNFALNAPPGCAVYTLDLPPHSKRQGASGTYATDAEIIDQAAPGSDYRGKDVECRIIQLFGNSLTYDFSPYYGQIDLVFVDGAHHYDAVKSDTENAIKMARPGGYIVWHDFANFGDYNDVTRAILDTLPAERITQVYNTQLAVYQKPA